jgi:hypothetical protein
MLDVLAGGLMDKKIEELEKEALRTGMKIDWEAGKLIPNPLAKMDHHQRALWARIETDRQRMRDYYDMKDNDPASPEQAGW